MKYLQLLGIGAFVACLSAGANAQMPPPHQPPTFAMPTHGMLGLPPFFAKLKLDEAQQDRLFSLAHAAAPAMREQMKILRKADEALRQLAFAEQYSEGAARAAAEDLGRGIVEMHLLRLRLVRQMFAVLTAEQQQEIQGDLRKFEIHGDQPPLPEKFAGRPEHCEPPPPAARKPALKKNKGINP